MVVQDGCLLTLQTISDHIIPEPSPNVDYVIRSLMGSEGIHTYHSWSEKDTDIFSEWDTTMVSGMRNRRHVQHVYVYHTIFNII